MSERGSFVTNFMYCEDCLAAAKEVLLGSGKFLMSTEIPHWDGVSAHLPIIAGKIGGLYLGEELDIFENEIIPVLKRAICHEMRIAVLAENSERIYHVSPNQT